MSAKKSNKSTVSPETIVLTEAELKLPEVKALLKRREELKKQEEINSRLPKVLEFAGTTFGKEFKTLAAFVKYVTKLSGKKAAKGENAPRLTDEQRAKIRELKKEGKTIKDIVASEGVTTGQVSVTLSGKKK